MGMSPQFVTNVYFFLLLHSYKKYVEGRILIIKVKKLPKDLYALRVLSSMMVQWFMGGSLLPTKISVVEDRC